MITPRPFWTEDFPRSERVAAGTPLPPEADLVIIGSGITGLTAARTALATGWSVAVVDALELAGGASAVNGGMVIYGLKAPADAVIRQHGPDLGREFWDASMRSIDIVEEIASEVPSDFARSGSIELGLHPRDAALLEDEVSWHSSHTGLPLTFHTRDELRPDVIGSDRFTSALTEPTSAGVHPAKLSFGLADLLIRRGASLTPHAEVTEVERSNNGYAVKTTRGSVRAGNVLVATNGYTDRLLPGLRRGIVPIGSYSAVTEPLGADVAERLMPGNRMAWTARRLLNYFRRTPDDRILMGGRQNLSPDLDLQESARDLRSRIVEFFPELADTQITHVWNGRLGVTFDLMPHIGRNDGVWYALGYGGHGLGIGSMLGTEVADLITGAKERSPFAEIPHPRRWYYRHRPWFLPLAAMGYRVLDRFSR